MPVDYKYRRGITIPEWQWMPPFVAGRSYHGAGSAYDGKRYIFYAVQYGSTTATSTGTASTSQLWKYDTVSHGWVLIAILNNGGIGLDLAYDAVRDLLFITNGSVATSWQVYNNGNVTRVVSGVTVTANSLATMGPVLPVGSNAGGSLSLPDDTSVAGNLSAANASLPVDTEVVAAGATTTSIPTTVANPVTNPQGSLTTNMIGLYARITASSDATLVNQRRRITAVPNGQTLTTDAFTAAPPAGSEMVVEVPEGTAVAGSTTTTLATGLTMTANMFSNADVVIVAGTGAGQRRRIASHDAAGVLTLTAAVAGNANTGAWTTTPDTTSVFRIVPSRDFVYFVPGGNLTGAYRLDISGSAAGTWANLAVMPGAAGGGANLFHTSALNPFQLGLVRGNGTRDIYFYNTGLNTWSAALTTFGSQETFGQGANVSPIPGRRKIFIQKEGTPRCYVVDLVTGYVDGFAQLPYTAGMGAYDGHRACPVKTTDGAEYMYLLRQDAQEFFRIPMTWY